MHSVLEDPARSKSDFPRGLYTCLNGPSYLVVSMCAPGPSPPPPRSCIASHALCSGCPGCREGRVFPRSGPRPLSETSPLRVVAATQTILVGGTTASSGPSQRHGWSRCHQYVEMMAWFFSYACQHALALSSYLESRCCRPMLCVSLLCTSGYIGASPCDTLFLLKPVLDTTRQTPELLHRLIRSLDVLPTSVIRSSVALRGGCVCVRVCSSSCLTAHRCHISAIPKYNIYVYVCRLLSARRRPHTGGCLQLGQPLRGFVTHDGGRHHVLAVRWGRADASSPTAALSRARRHARSCCAAPAPSSIPDNRHASTCIMVGSGRSLRQLCLHILPPR